MMYRGGNAYTADRNVALLAGATLGGGTTINWQNCVLPSDKMRREWATEHGLTGLDTEEFDLHLSAVLLRVGANDRCSDFNGPHQRMAEGARALGWSLRTAVRNVDEDTYNPALAATPSSEIPAAASVARCRPTWRTRSTTAQGQRPAFGQGVATGQVSSAPLGSGIGSPHTPSDRSTHRPSRVLPCRSRACSSHRSNRHLPAPRIVEPPLHAGSR
jgi:hypothetical protein